MDLMPQMKYHYEAQIRREGALTRFLDMLTDLGRLIMPAVKKAVDEGLKGK